MFPGNSCWRHYWKICSYPESILKRHQRLHFLFCTTVLPTVEKSDGAISVFVSAGGVGKSAGGVAPVRGGRSVGHVSIARVAGGAKRLEIFSVSAFCSQLDAAPVPFVIAQLLGGRLNRIARQSVAPWPKKKRSRRDQRHRPHRQSQTNTQTALRKKVLARRKPIFDWAHHKLMDAKVLFL